MGLGARSEAVREEPDSVGIEHDILPWGHVFLPPVVSQADAESVVVREEKSPRTPRRTRGVRHSTSGGPAARATFPYFDIAPKHEWLSMTPHLPSLGR